MKHNATLSILIGLIFFVFTMAFWGTPSHATMAMKKEVKHSSTSSPPSHTTSRSSSAQRQKTATHSRSTTTHKRKSPVPSNKPDLSITKIALKNCILHITLCNAPYSGRLSNEDFQKGRLTVSFKAPGGKTKPPKGFTISLQKLDPKHALNSHNPFDFNAHIRLTSPVTVIAELNNIPGDGTKGTKKLTKTLRPSALCRPKTTLASRTSSHQQTLAGPSNITLKPERKTKLIAQPFDLSIQRVYENTSNHHLLVVLKNVGKGIIPSTIFSRGEVFITLEPKHGAAPPATTSHLVAMRKATKRFTLAKIDPHHNLNRVSKRYEATFDTGLVLSQPVTVTIRFANVKGDGKKGKKRITYVYPPKGKQRMMARVKPRVVSKGKTQGVRKSTTPFPRQGGKTPFVAKRKAITPPSAVTPSHSLHVSSTTGRVLPPNTPRIIYLRDIRVSGVHDGALPVGEVELSWHCTDTPISLGGDETCLPSEGRVTIYLANRHLQRELGTVSASAERFQYNLDSAAYEPFVGTICQFILDWYPPSGTTGNLRHFSGRFHLIAEREVLYSVGGQILTLLSPRGGEKIYKGKAYAIQWQYENSFQPSANKQVKIDLYFKGNYSRTLGRVPTSGFPSFMWVPEDLASFAVADSYQIKLQLVETSGGRESVLDTTMSEDFSINIPVLHVTLRDSSGSFSPYRVRAGDILEIAVSVKGPDSFNGYSWASNALNGTVTIYEKDQVTDWHTIGTIQLSNGQGTLTWRIPDYPDTKRAEISAELDFGGAIGRPRSLSGIFLIQGTSEDHLLPSAPPLNGRVTVTSSFTPDIKTLQAVAYRGGDVDVSSYISNPPRSGAVYTTAAPSLVLHWENDVTPLPRVKIIGADLILTPQGDYITDGIIVAPQGGDYKIWLVDERNSGGYRVLSISKLMGDNFPVVYSFYSNLHHIHHGFRPSNMRLFAISLPPQPSSLKQITFTPAFSGLSTPKSAYAFYWSGQTGSLRIYATHSDIGLAIRKPTGEFVCSHARGNVLIPNPSEGIYEIWYVYEGNDSSPSATASIMLTEFGGRD